MGRFQLICGELFGMDHELPTMYCMPVIFGFSRVYDFATFVGNGKVGGDTRIGCLRLRCFGLQVPRVMGAG